MRRTFFAALALSAFVFSVPVLADVPPGDGRAAALGALTQGPPVGIAPAVGPSAVVAPATPAVEAQAPALAAPSVMAAGAASPVQVPDPESNPEGYFAVSLDAILRGDWWLLAALALRVVVLVVRKLGTTRWPALASLPGTIVTTLLLSFFAGFTHTLLATGTARTADVVLAALKAAGFALLPEVLRLYTTYRKQQAESAGATAAAAVGGDRQKAVSTLTGQGPRA